MGAGPAGCVLASRLSEDPGIRVALIEAGPDVSPGDEPRDVLNSFPVASSGCPRYYWPGLTAATGAAVDNGTPSPQWPYIQPCCVGGGSSINGMAADRAMPSDFDEWGSVGVIGWSWHDVLPYYHKLERRSDPVGECTDAPADLEAMIPIRIVSPATWGEFCKRIADAMSDRGFTQIDDCLVDQRDGFSSMPLNSVPGRRVSASMAYLNSGVRERSNLTIIAKTLVSHLLIDEKTVGGVAVESSNGARKISARQTILSAGAIQSPALLMKSGIGPSDHLITLGLPIVQSLPGVGANLQNHPAVTFVTYLSRKAAQSPDNRSMLQNWLRYTSGLVPRASRDMVIMAFNKCAWHPLGTRIGALMVAVFKPYSKGSVRLIRARTSLQPVVDFNLLSDPRDMDRLVEGSRLALELLVDSQVTKVRREVFLPSGQIVGRLSLRNRTNYVLAAILRTILDVPRLRRAVLGKSALDIGLLLRSNEALREYVKRTAQAVYHLAGTCRMGVPSDPNAVVTSSCDVIGMTGVKVVDASIFPTVPNANPHITVIMAAEKIAHEIRSART